MSSLGDRRYWFGEVGSPGVRPGRAGPLSVLAGTPGADLSSERAALGAAFVQTQNLPLAREVVGSRQGKPRASRVPSPAGLPSGVFSTFTQSTPSPSLPPFSFPLSASPSSSESQAWGVRSPLL